MFTEVATEHSNGMLGINLCIRGQIAWEAHSKEIVVTGDLAHLTSRFWNLFLPALRTKLAFLEI